MAATKLKESFIRWCLCEDLEQQRDPLIAGHLAVNMRNQ